MIGGPTASGKTSLSIALAQYFSCPIISADSRQFYKEMNIGTAKPAEEEMRGIVHHFINSLSIHDEYSVGQYERECIDLLNDLFEKHDIIILTGGSGLYLKAIEEGIDEFPTVKSEDIDHYKTIHTLHGNSALQNELIENDPEYAAITDMDNPHRLIRALSVIKSTKKKFSSFRKGKNPKRSFRTIKIKIDIDRSELYERINTRVDHMISLGLIDEVRSLMPYKHLNPLNTVGYKEIIAFLSGQISRETAILKIKQHTRNYAKRQMTWFNNQGMWHCVDANDLEGTIVYLEGIMAKNMLI